MTSDFLKSEMIRGDLQEQAELQRFCFQCAASFPILSKEKKLVYFNAIKELIEKMKLFYFRINLIDDPEAKELVESMKIAVKINANQLGASYSEDILEIFDNVKNRVDNMIEKLEAEEG
jgi:hypothetical protein